MSRNGSGTYNLPAGQPVVTGTTISSSTFNTLTNDLANALTTSVCTDGQSVMTGNLQMGAKKITNLGNGSSSTDAAAYGQLTTGLINAQTAIQAKNFLLNGQMRLASNSQFSNISSTAYAGSINNWVSQSSNGVLNGIFNQIAVSGGTYQYMAKLGRNNTDTTAATLSMAQALKTNVSVPLAGQNVVLSFIALAGANFSATSNLITVKLCTGTGTDQTESSMLAGTWTGFATPISTTQAITTSASRYTFTASIPTTATQVGVIISYTTSGTAGADDNLYITQTQLEIAQNGQTTASSFEQLSYADDLFRSVGITGSNKNYLINPNFAVAQTGSSYSLTTSTAYTSIDNWFAAGGTGVSGVVNQSGSILTGTSTSLQIGRNNGSTSTAVMEFGQVLESYSSTPFAGKTAILSFYAKAGANFSGGNLTVTLWYGTGSNQSSVSLVAGTWTGQATVINVAPKITSTTTRYFFTGAVPSNATQLGLVISYTGSGTAGADDNVYFTNMQLEVARPGQLMPSEFMQKQYVEDLRECQRYRYVLSAPNGTVLSGGVFNSTSTAVFSAQLPAPMALSPTSAVVGTIGNMTLSDVVAASSAVTSLSFSSSTPSNVLLSVTGTGTPYTSGKVAFLQNNATGALVVFNAGL